MLAKVLDALYRQHSFSAEPSDSVTQIRFYDSSSDEEDLAEEEGIDAYFFCISSGETGSHDTFLVCFTFQHIL